MLIAQGGGGNNTSMCSYIALAAFCTSADKKNMNHQQQQYIDTQVSPAPPSGW